MFKLNFLAILCALFGCSTVSYDRPYMARSSDTLIQKNESSFKDSIKETIQRTLHTSDKQLLTEEVIVKATYKPKHKARYYFSRESLRGSPCKINIKVNCKLEIRKGRDFQGMAHHVKKAMLYAFPSENIEIKIIVDKRKEMFRLSAKGDLDGFSQEKMVEYLRNN